MPDYTPSWARSGGTDKYPPKNPSDYAAFVKVLAQRYAPMGVHAWEIWNEPNNKMFWAPRADAVAYTALLKQAYTAIKSADASATVVSGGLSPASDSGGNISPLTFTASMYAHGAHGSFDALGLHPYSYPYAPMYVGSWNTFYRTPDLHALMAQNGDSAKTVWATEIGFPTGSGSGAVSQQAQAGDIVAAIEQWRSWWFHGPIIFYTLRDKGSSQNDVDQNMGLENRTGGPKPSYVAVRQLLLAPQDVRATSTSGGASVTWTPPAWDAGKPITQYKVVAKNGATAMVRGDARAADVAIGSGVSTNFVVVPVHGSVDGIASLPSNTVVAGAPATPSVEPGIGVVTKPATGTVTMQIPVSLSAPSTATVTVGYQTASYPPSVNARPGIDYVLTRGTLRFSPGQTRASIPVTVNARRRTRPNDVFFVLFDPPTNANLGGFYGIGVGVIGG